MTLGYPSADALQRDMTSHQFAEMLAFQRVEPLGQRREDLRAAVIAAAVRNAFAQRGDVLTQPQDILAEVFDFWPEPTPDESEDEVYSPEEVAEQEDNLLQFASLTFGKENRT